MISIDDARKMLGKTYSMEFGGLTFYYKPVNILLDVSTSEERHVFFTLVAVYSGTGEKVENKTELYDAGTFIKNVNEGKSRQCMIVNGINIPYSIICNEYQYCAVSWKQYETIQTALVSNGYYLSTENADYAYYTKGGTRIYVERNY